MDLIIDYEAKYQKYFDIDPSYYPVMTEDLIKEDDTRWKNFYPHDTFIDLLRKAVDAIKRTEKKSIWVTGAYGTGKTHAVLTLKKLLEASQTEVSEYFKKNNLDPQLEAQINAFKEGPQKVLTVYRYGSSDLKNTAELTYRIQSSIKKALKEQGFEDGGVKSLKDDIIRSLKDDPAFSQYINTKIQHEFRSTFSPCTSVEQLLEILETENSDEADEYIRKYLRMMDSDNHFKLDLTPSSLVSWTKEIIEVNNLKAIFFIWDEFSEFFGSNTNNLTGFQEIVESTQKQPFILTIVTHLARGQLPGANAKKIGDRFSGTVEIKLPDNMAFKLIGRALSKTPEYQSEWNLIRKNLWESVSSSGQYIISELKNTITQEDLKEILPIHPYAGLVLKHISTSFNSNQRSMFEYIKGDQSEYNTHNFKAFIHDKGPYDEKNPYLTCDILWDYFFGGDSYQLSSEHLRYYNAYVRSEERSGLDEETKSVLKTVLLLQLLSQDTSTGNILSPSLKNIQYSYSGVTVLNEKKLRRCLDNLVNQNILTKEKIRNEPAYALPLGSNNTQKISQRIEELRKSISTSKILGEINVEEFIRDKINSDQLFLRYKITCVTERDISLNFSSRKSDGENVIPVYFAFARDQNEALSLSENINNCLASSGIQSKNYVIVNFSHTTLLEQEFESILEEIAQRDEANRQGNQKDTSSHQNRLYQQIENWVNNCLQNEVILYYPSGEPHTLSGQNELKDWLEYYQKDQFPKGIDALSRNAALFKNPTPSDVKEALKSDGPKGKFNQVDIKNLWNDPMYWETYPEHTISIIKIAIDQLIKDEFETNGQISMDKIWSKFSKRPYGFLPCSLSAFVLGFVLKEYATNQYSWSNGSTSEDMSPEKLAEFVLSAFKPKGVPMYIKQMTDEEKAFLNGSAFAFNFSDTCLSIETAQTSLSSAINKLGYPLWALEYCEQVSRNTYANDIKEILTEYCNIVSGQISDPSERKTVITRIGKRYLGKPNLASTLQSIISQANAVEGMRVYVHENFPALEEYAKQLNNADYINAIKKKQSSDSAWLWSSSDINKTIKLVCLEYKACQVSSLFVGITSSMDALQKGWSEKLTSIKIPKDLILQKIDDPNYFEQFVESVKQIHVSTSENIVNFVTYLEENGEFLANTIFSTESQRYMFTTYCQETYSNDLPDVIVESLFEMISTKGNFGMPLDRFKGIIDTKISEHKITQYKTELQEKWEILSDTASPEEWSHMKNFPILLLFETETTTAREVFEILNGRSPSLSSIEKLKSAIDFLENPIFQNLKDSEYVSQKFIEKILRKYALIIDAKNHQPLVQQLKSQVDQDPYNWVDKLDLVYQVVEKYAQSCYLETGYNAIVKSIDEMPPERAKNYLKTLVKDHLDVGLAIISDVKGDLEGGI